MDQAVQRVHISVPDLSAIVEAMTDSFIVLDADFNCVCLNHHAESLSQRNRQDILGKPFWSVFPELLVIDVEHQLRNVMSARAAIRFDRFYEPTDKWYQVNVTPVPESGICILLQDITDNKRREAELVQKIEELARSNEDLQRFASAVSHDLQQPLRTVRTQAELIAKKMKGTLSTDCEASLGFVVSGVAQMQKLVQGLLRYSQVDSDYAFTKTIVDVNSVIAAVLNQLQSSIEESAATITFDTLPTIWAAEEPLVEVFQNLITNALKYHALGRDPKVHVSAMERRHEWVFAVQDNGIGIENQHVKKVFAPFQHLHSASQYEGSGLGLAICKRIIERHGGRIWVESEPGTGSTFLFTFPTVK